jgi:hypothetical protein
MSSILFWSRATITQEIRAICTVPGHEVYVRLAA